MVFVFICHKVNSIFFLTLRILRKESALPSHNIKPTLKSISDEGNQKSNSLDSYLACIRLANVDNA